MGPGGFAPRGPLLALSGREEDSGVSPRGLSTGHLLHQQRRRLLADEQGTLHKVARLRVALCYPSPYHVGMSSLGFQTIYREVHAHPGATAERAFLPDDVEAFRASRSPPFTVESGAALADFPVLAFSVAYELELTGLFTLLDLAGIPLLAAERGEGWPLIVAGGPLTFSNPEPLEPFVDVLVQGEADALVHQLLDALQAGDSREPLLDALARTPGFRVPGRGGPSLHVAAPRTTGSRPARRSSLPTPSSPRCSSSSPSAAAAGGATTA